MSRTCTICTHAERAAIDVALVTGESLRDIAGQYHLSKSALERHRRDHLPGALATAREAEQVADADDLLAQLAGLKVDARRIGQKAEDVAEFPAALQAIREQARIIELLLKVAGELAEGPQMSVLVMPEWVAVRAAMLAALRSFPDARHAVAAALLRIEGGDDSSA